MKVLVSDKLSEQGLAILKKAKGITVDVKTGMKPEELIKVIGDYDGLVIRSGTTVTPAVVEAAQKLKVIGRAGIGVDNVDLPSASKKGIVVMNTPTGNATTTAEHAVSMMCAVSRKIPQATASLKSGKWEKSKFTGSELSNKSLGLVGAGNIGKIVANRAQGLKMNVLSFDPFLSAEVAEKEGMELVSLDELVKRADYISVHTPLNDKTRNLINADLFQKMKKGVYIINCARGGIVNEQDLENAIKSGIVAGAALDVFEKEPPDPNHPLLQLDEVIATPHLGAATGEAQVNVAVEIAEQVVDFLNNGTIRNAVNVPSVSGEMLKVMQPFISLSEKLGSLQGQMTDRLPSALTIEYRGDVTKYDCKPVTAALLKGLLTATVSGESVNYVNAPFIASSRGLKVTESVVSEHQNFSSLISLTIKIGDEERTVSGTIFGKVNPRIVQWNEFYLEAVPEGKILIVYNEDVPGVIGHIGTYLGERKINISRMQLGLNQNEKKALGFFNVEGNVTPEIIEGLKGLKHITSACLVCL
jgi:D-3-phosphoglycerate dehydrogenase / 2-oxoglutarate reductase